MERSLYLLIDLGSIAFPLLASFERRIAFHRKWRGLFPGIAAMMALFIPWDAAFTAHGVWGFSERYTLGIDVLGLPVEEWMFFIAIPYACLFLYEVMRHFVARDVMGRAARPLSLVLIALLTLAGLFHLGRWYTAATFLGTAAFLAYTVLVLRPAWLGRFYVGYAVSLVPFFVVNGLLTGWLLPEPVVWYNNAENLGIRMGTIPVEDSVYMLLMLLMVTVLYERPLKRPHGDPPAA